MSNAAATTASSWRRLIAPGLATLVAFAILVSLGSWQLRRLEWKEGLLGRMHARVHAAPTPLPSPDAWQRLSPPEYEYLRVETRGVFEHQHELYVFHAAGQPREPGWLVMTPLRLPSGHRVIVNRGFVPMRLQDPAARAQGQISGETLVTGLMRAPEPRNPFTPADDPARPVAYVQDPAISAARFDLPDVAPFFIDADATPVPGGWPKGGQTEMSIPNNHLSYALTWFGLAVTLLAVFGVFARRRLKES